MRFALKTRPANLHPLAAHIVSRLIGLALSCGGARGFAHLGMLEELEAAGLPVDPAQSISAWER